MGPKWLYNDVTCCQTFSESLVWWFGCFIYKVLVKVDPSHHASPLHNESCISVLILPVSYVGLDGAAGPIGL